jgi:hypothetical protein
MPPSRKRKAHPASSHDTTCAFLLEWCTAQGAVLDGCELVQDSSGLSRGFVATKHLRPGHCVISIPHTLFVTTEVAMRSAVGALIAAFHKVRIVPNLEAERLRWANTDRAEGGELVVTRRSVLYAFLIHQRHIEAEGLAWEPFARSLPQHFSTPFSWQADELGHATLRAEVEAL